MKKILLSQRIIENESYPEQREALDVRWGSLLHELDLVPIPASLRFPPRQLFTELLPQGVLLTGGNSLACITANPLDQARDDFERELVHQARALSLPVLGICRGLQFLVHYFGGSLSQVENHAGTRHTINVDKSCRYSHLLSGIKTVNSFHNDMTGQLPDTLRSIARADDGTIEAIEHVDEPILGIMWHPEREKPFCLKSMNLMKSFFDA